MVEINSDLYKSYIKLCSVNEKPNNHSLNFCANNQNNKKQEINELPASTNYTQVKVPISYSKIGEINLPYDLKAHIYKLANGQKIVILPKEGKTVLKSYVNTGSLNEPDRIRGISHYIEHNLFNGSEGLEAGEFFKTTDKIGAETNASTGLAETNYFISSNLLNDTDLEQEIKIHASMLESPRFAADMLEKEKGIVNSEINMITSNPDNVAINTTLKNLFNIKTTSNDIIAGTTNNINSLEREDVVDYFNKNYFPANTVTVVTGEIEPEETIKLIAKYFNSTKVSNNPRYYEKLTPIDKSVRNDIISDKAQSSIVTLGFEGPKNNDIKFGIYTAALLKLMLSSNSAQNIFKTINANIDYTQEKVLSKPNAPKAIVIVSEVSEENNEKLLNKIYKRIQEFQNKPISEDELQIIKRDMKKEFVNMFESSHSVNDFIGTSILDGQINEINKIEQIIDNITAKELQETAKNYFDLNKTAITVLHTNSSNAESINSNYKKSNSINFTGKHKQAINMDRVKLYDLKNNYRVSLYDSPYPNINAEFIVRTETPVYSKNPAAYIVINEILKNGTKNKNREKFYSELEKNGININVSANEFGIYGSFDADKLSYDNAFKAYRELIEEPRFDEETFHNAVNTVYDKFTRMEKTPWNKLAPVLSPKTSHTKEEILEGLKTLNLTEVKELYSKLYLNSHSIASIAAPINVNTQLKEHILYTISGLKQAKPYVNVLQDNYSPINKPIVLTDTDNKSQANILMAYKYKDVSNIKDEATLELLNKILGSGPTSRLFNDLRESQKLAYAVKSTVSRENNTGSIVLQISTTTDNKETGEKSYDNLQKAITGFQKHIEKITSEKVTDEELNKAKLSVKNEILSLNEKTLVKNISLLEGCGNFYGPNWQNQLLETIDKITPEDIYNAAKYIFSGNPVYSITATEDTLNYNKNYLDNLKK